MIPQIQHRAAIISSGIFIAKPIQIDMDNTEHIFSMLSEMYSDRVKTVCREYATNGLDAMRDAGTLDTKELEITLPTRLDQNFRVRDYGTGLSEEGIDNIFCFTGKSTKREDAEANGTLGIGSKSAYCYSDTWMINSFYDGHKTTYQCRKNEKGVPEIVPVFDMLTDEDNGLEIVIPVKSGDIDEFQRAAKNVYSYFMPIPVVHNKSDYYPIARDKAIFSGDGWAITGKTSVAIMSNVAYPIDYQQVIAYPTDEEKAKGIEGGEINPMLVQSGIELDFVNGTLQFAPSREGLKYTDFTKHNLTAAIEVVAKGLVKNVLETFVDKENVWEAKIHHRQFFHDMGTLGYKLSRELKGKVLWNGIVIDDDTFRKTEGTTIGYYTESDRTDGLKRKKVDAIQAKNDTFVVINDLNTGNGSPTRIKKLYDDAVAFNGCYVITFEDKVAKDLFFEKNDFNTVPYLLLSEMEKSPTAPRAAKVANGKHNLSCFSFIRDSSHNYTNSKAWEVKNIDFKTGAGMWVKLDRFEAIRLDGHKGLGANAFEQLLTNLEKLGIKIPVIHGIKPAMLDKQELGKGWVNFFEWAIKEIEKVAVKEEISQKTINRDYLSKHYSRDYDFLENNIKEMVETSEMKKFLEAVSEMRVDDDIDTKIHLVSCVRGAVGLGSLVTGTPTHDVKAMKEDIIKSYPMLIPAARGYSSLGYYSTEIFDYITIIDKLK